jgi:hypothetical protein
LGAGFQASLPACDARTLQVPAATKRTVLPETAQTPVVVEAKLTVNPEDAVALTTYVPPTVALLGGVLVKVIV